jgi:uncharacterized membrane protein YhaH (DUF805 family)
VSRPMDENQVFGLAAIAFVALFGLAIFVLSVIVWWRIVSRTGHSGWLSLLMFVPIANIVLMLILAFGEWPIYRELEDLRRRAMAG